MPLITTAPYHFLDTSSAANTKLLMHFDGVNNGTNFVDECGTIPTSATGLKTSTVKSKFGGSSLRCDSGKLVMPTTVSLSGDFTFEMWVMFDSVATQQVFFDARQNGTGDAPVIYWNGTAFAFIFNNSIIANTAGAGNVATANTWVNVAMSRQNGTVSCFVNGARVGQMVRTVATSTQAITIAAAGTTTQNFPFKGYMDEIRICEVGLYSSNYTPAVSPFTL